MALQSGASPIPAGDTMPIPVTTMRRASITLPSLEKIEDALLHQRARDQRPEELRLALRVRVVHQLEGRPGGRRPRARARARAEAAGAPAGSARAIAPASLRASSTTRPGATQRLTSPMRWASGA